MMILGCDRGPTQPPPPARTYTHSDMVMGTMARVIGVADEPPAARAAVDAAFARLNDVNRLMSDYIDDSEIGRLNKLPAGGSLEVSPETFACIHRALEVAGITDGAFDPTCRPLVALWKRAGKTGKLPSEEALSATRTRVGYDKLQLDETTRTVSVTAAGMQVDLGGIAKGYALDLAAAAMKESGAIGGLVDVGGDIVAFGVQENGAPWRVGVRDPDDPGSGPRPIEDVEIFSRLVLRDVAVATSGNQERFSVIEGRRYSHIIDPRTGLPTEHAPSVTVLAPDGMTADVFATVFSVLTPEEGLRIIAEKLPDAGVEVMWIERSTDAPGDADGSKVTKTAGFDRYLAEQPPSG